MACETRNLERFFEVGAVMMLHTDVNRKDGPRYRSVLRGWRKGSHILLDRPKTEHGSFVALLEGQEVVLRFLHEGQACAYNAHVIDWDTRRHNPYMRVTWPRELQYVAFRRFERIKVEFACQLFRPDGTRMAAEIRDLSMGGCAVHAPAAVNEGSTILLEFDLPDGVQVKGAKAVVKSARDLGGKWFLGCEFPEPGPGNSELSFYVTANLERTRGGAPDEGVRRVLVIDADAEFATRLRTAFDKRGVDVVIAEHPLDAFHRLRAALPLAVVASVPLPGLDGLEVCRLLRSHRDFKALPFYLYGGEGADLADKAHKAGAQGYFAPCVSLAPDIAFEVGEAIKESAKAS